MGNNILKNHIENNHLKYFLETDIGINFVKQEKCTELYKNERPDYIFKTQTGNVGFELTVLAQNTIYTRLFQSLNSIVNKVFKRIDKELKYKYFINLICLENDIKKISIQESKLVEQIFITVEKYEKKETIPSKSKYSIGNITIEGKHNIEEIITKNGLRFKLVFSKNSENYNFGGTPVFAQVQENPINLIQEAINNKEEKKSSYCNCEKQCLLIISDPFVSKGNMYHFNEKILKHVFKSSFDNIFLLELGGKNNINVYQLLHEYNTLGVNNAK